MKLLSVHSPQGPRLAALLPSGIVLFDEISDRMNAHSFPQTMEDLVFRDGGIEDARPLLEEAIVVAKQSELVRPVSAHRPAMLYQPRTILCVGRNYRAHAEESGDAIPKAPILFAKWSNCVAGPGDTIILPPVTEEVDYEAELAVIIGRTCTGTSAETALDYVSAYTCLNDISARDFQREDGQWTRAKSQDTFGPFGPCLVTRDEIPDPQDLSIRCSVNGHELQNSHTSLMIFPVRELMAFVSRGITLRPGDILSTGTPDGVGFARKPPIFLKDGDEVVVAIEGIGELRNPVRGRPENR
jgi:2-keto-4-pentenoate hydratase/2-oxohepta-3-ene-1,7-dioic acid hydratase in catechol pathway